jgi:hypothetical protein
VAAPKSSCRRHWQSNAVGAPDSNPHGVAADGRRGEVEMAQT